MFNNFIYILAVKKNEQKGDYNVVMVFAAMIKSRLQIDFYFYKAMDCLVSSLFFLSRDAQILNFSTDTRLFRVISANNDSLGVLPSFKLMIINP